MINSKPENVGLSASRLHRIHDWTSSYIDTGRLAGTITLVARRGQVVHFESNGKLSLETGQAMPEDALFRIHSMTKPVTAVAVMMLYERGYFQLDTPVSQFIPAFKDTEVFASGTVEDYTTVKPQREMTIGDLLRHGAGLTYGFLPFTIVDQLYLQAGILESVNDDSTLETFVNKLATMPLLFSPGTQWSYSLSMDVLGRVIEVITGKSLDVFFQEEIFEPLNMVDTGFILPTEKQDRLASIYVNRIGLPESLVQDFPDKTIFLNDDPKTNYYQKSPTKMMGGIGLVSTASDYYQFATMLLNKGRVGKECLLSPKTIEFMTMNHLPGDIESFCVKAFSDPKRAGMGFGLGFGVNIDAAKANLIGSPGTFHWSGMAHTTFFVDPKEELIGIFLSQILPYAVYDTVREFRRMVYQAIVG